MLLQGELNVKLEDDGIMPRQGTGNPAGIDLAIPHDVTLFSYKPTAVDLRVAFELPDFMCGLLIPRSSMRFKGLTIGNTVGLIDNDYQGNINVTVIYDPMKSVNPSHHIKLNKGEFLFQLLIVPYFMATQINLVDKLVKPSERGALGFGSTDILKGID